MSNIKIVDTVVAHHRLFLIVFGSLQQNVFEVGVRGVLRFELQSFFPFRSLFGIFVHARQ